MEPISSGDASLDPKSKRLSSVTLQLLSASTETLRGVRSEGRAARSVG